MCNHLSSAKETTEIMRTINISENDTLEVIMKKIYSLLLSIVMIATMVCPVSASSNVTFHHGNNNSTKKCYAQTTQTGTDSIGALITWQVSTSNTVVYGTRSDGNGYSVTSYSSSLRGKSGKSYGYFYHNGNEYTCSGWYSFSF